MNEQMFISYMEKFKTEMRQIVKEEISLLNIPKILDEQNKKIEQLSNENEALKRDIKVQQKRLDSMYRQNNLVFNGLEESEEEGSERLEVRILDVCNNVMGVELNSDEINRIRRIGLRGDRPRPVILSLLTNAKKYKLLQKSFKLKGSKIFLSEDLDKEEREIRQKLFSIKYYLKRELQTDAKIRRDGLIVGSEFVKYEDLLQKYGDKVFNETQENKKKRRRVGNGKNNSSQIHEFFRPRTGSSSSTKSSK